MDFLSSCVFSFSLSSIIYFLLPKYFKIHNQTLGKQQLHPGSFLNLSFSSCSLQPVGSRSHTHMHPSASRCARWMVCRTIDQLSRHQRTDCQPTVRLYVRACNSSLYTNTNFSLSLTHSLSSHRAYGLPQFLGTLTRPFH